MSEEVKELMFFGVLIKDIVLLVIGATIGLGASEYTAWRLRKHDKKKEKKKLKEETIVDVVKFVNKADDVISDAKRYLNRALKIRLEGLDVKYNWPAWEAELERFAEKRANLSQEWKVNTFLLARIDEELKDDFEKLLKASVKYLSVLNKNIPEVLSSRDIQAGNDNIGKKEFDNWRNLIIDFQNKCLAIIGTVAPKRTLSAPDKKKGPRRNG